MTSRSFLRSRAAKKAQPYLKLDSLLNEAERENLVEIANPGNCGTSNGTCPFVYVQGNVGITKYYELSRDAYSIKNKTLIS